MTRKTKHNITPQRHLGGMGALELVIDSFAGGGGASTGIERALGRTVDIAVNHDEAALVMHRANHPQTLHYQEDVFHLDPAKVTRGRPIGLLWLSPDCRHHSKAKGGKPVSPRVRGLAWVAIRWAKLPNKPRCIMLENVEEFQKWGPLEQIAGKGWMPDPKRRGETFLRFVAKLESHGYTVEWRELRACDYGAPTTRKRLFLIARSDGEAIQWPAPTHGVGRAHPHRSAAEIIDWTLPCPSIFTRAKPLADATMRRIARGIHRFVLDHPRPFIVTMDNQQRLTAPHVTKFKQHSTGTDAREPLHTITAGGHSEHMAGTPHGFGLVSASLIPVGYGERPTEAPRILDIEKPLTTVAGHGMHGLVTAFLAKHYGGPKGQQPPGIHPERPLDTITTEDHHAVVTAHLTSYYGERRDGEARGVHVEDPLPTQTTENRFGVVQTSFISRHFGTSTGHAADAPLATTLAGANKSSLVNAMLVKYRASSDAQDRLEPDRAAFGTVTVAGEVYEIADIGMRMLTPAELFRAQGFPLDYDIAPMWKCKPLSKAHQVRMCGNSVCPPIAEALVRANFAHDAAVNADPIPLPVAPFIAQAAD